MIAMQELIDWAIRQETLNQGSGVAIDDGGLTLVAFTDAGVKTGGYYEVGGISLPGEDDVDE